MTTPVIETPQHPHERGAHTPTIGSLLTAELTRVRSRRFVRWATLGLLGVMVLVAVINFNQSMKPTAQQVTQATTACPQPVATDESGNELPRDPSEGPTSCTVREAAQYGAFEERPNLRSDIPEEILGVGLGVAVLGFIFGCTVGGADWSQKTMAALLFWEPRRARVFLAKLAALLITVTALLVGAVVVWLVLKSLLIQTHGVADVSWGSISQDLWTDLGRSLVLVLTMSAVAYGIASLARNTGAALGVGFVYFAVVELFINALLPRLGQWTLTVNVGALFTPGGLQPERDGVEHAVSSLHGGLVLVLYAVVICGIGLELFRRRDVT